MKRFALCAGVILCQGIAGCGENDQDRNPTCQAGYVLSGKSCVDINECTANTDNCSADATCANTDGSFTCTCKSGYSGSGVVCTDIDECIAETDNCDANAVCANTTGSFTCTCEAGFSGDGETCTDINECTANTDDCGANAQCTNTVGSFTCACLSGFSGNGVTCTDINECTASTDNCSADATCANTVGSFTCTCLGGFTGNGVTCTDIDECTANTDNCDVNAECTNTAGSFTCVCLSGYTGNGVTCTDKNECELGEDDCGGTSTCLNTTGSYECTCADGYHYDATLTDCTDTDECAVYTEVVFARPNNEPATVDCITDGVCIARGNTGPLYNSAVEAAAAPGGCDSASPADTEWSRGQCLGNMGPFLPFAAAAGCSPQSVIGQTICLHLLTDDVYFDVEFSSYTGGGAGGGFAYTRTLSLGGPCGARLDNSDVLTCSNTDGSFTCSSTCPNGFEHDGTKCIDTNECDSGACSDNTDCVNFMGSYACVCKPGYSGNVNSGCGDYDECAHLLDNCDRNNGSCVNEDGTFSCECVLPAILAADGHTCEITCPATCPANSTCLADGTNAACVCNRGFVVDETSCVPANPCLEATSVYFEKPGYTSLADCIVPDVCITRGANRPLYNAVVESSYGDESPRGTLWYDGTCENAPEISDLDNWATFNPNGVNYSLPYSFCMLLPEHGLLYDILITAWGNWSGGGFAYVRTAYQPDGCGVVGATCDYTGGVLSCSDCPTDWTIDTQTGKCKMPEPCATDLCDASATCLRTGLDTYICQCNAVEFTKVDYGYEQDCIRPDVCITRGVYSQIYNAAQEGQPPGSTCSNPSPVGTLWAGVPCNIAAEDDFDTFISDSFTDCWPPGMVGVHGCLKIPAAGDYVEEIWDIQINSWTSGGAGGGFSYRRWHDVADSTVCQ